MPTPTRMVIYFDDGTSEEIPLNGMSSIFLNEGAAAKCGHNPPYQQGTPPLAGGAVPLMNTMSTTGGTCYYVNGVIVCP